MIFEMSCACFGHLLQFSFPLYHIGVGDSPVDQNIVAIRRDGGWKLYTLAVWICAWALGQGFKWDCRRLP